MTTLSLWGSGSWGGNDGNAWGGSTLPLHYYALKKIFPIKDLQGAQDDDMRIDGKYLDQVYYQVDDLLANLFPDTATTDYSEPFFEKMFNVTSQAEVLAAEQALVNKNGKMSPAYFVQLGVSLGYTDVTIHEGVSDMFILAPSTYPPASLLPHAVFNQAHIWVWEISSSMIAVDDRPVWELIVTKASPAWAQIIFIYT